MSCLSRSLILTNKDSRLSRKTQEKVSHGEFRLPRAALGRFQQISSVPGPEARESASKGLGERTYE